MEVLIYSLFVFFLLIFYNIFAGKILVFTKRLQLLDRRITIKGKRIKIYEINGGCSVMVVGVSPFAVILISKGLKQVLDEDEVNALLYHELGHISNGHLEKRVALNVLRMTLQYALVALFCGVFVGLIYLFAINLLNHYLLKVEKSLVYKQEFEADMYSANKFPASLCTALQKIRVTSMIDPYPSTVDRILKITNYTANEES